jgi:hypothetical protein
LFKPTKSAGFRVAESTSPITGRKMVYDPRGAVWVSAFQLSNREETKTTKRREASAQEHRGNAHLTSGGFDDRALPLTLRVHVNVRTILLWVICWVNVQNLTKRDESSFENDAHPTTGITAR